MDQHANKHSQIRIHCSEYILIMILDQINVHYNTHRRKNDNLQVDSLDRFVREIHQYIAHGLHDSN